MNRDPLESINRIAANLGLFGSRRRRNSLIWWNPPKDWKRTRYAFGYTPWRTEFEGQTGYFAFKYRILRGDRFKLVKAVRFAKRKIAKKRAEKWYNQYYGVKDQ